MCNMLTQFFFKKILLWNYYYRGKSPNWDIGPWALFEDMDASEDE